MGKHDRRETSGQPPDSRPVTIQVPLPVLGVVHGVREAFHGLCIATGLQVLEAMMEADRAVLCGPKGRHQVERPAWRGGSVESPVTLGGRQVEVPRLRVRSADGEVPLVSFQWAAATDPLNEHTLAAVAAGVSTRRYAGTLDPVPVDVTERATSSSAVSRRFVALSTKRLEAFLGRPLGELDLRLSRRGATLSSAQAQERDRPSARAAARGYRQGVAGCLGPRFGESRGAGAGAAGRVAGARPPGRSGVHPGRTRRDADRAAPRAFRARRAAVKGQRRPMWTCPKCGAKFVNRNPVALLPAGDVGRLAGRTRASRHGALPPFRSADRRVRRVPRGPGEDAHRVSRPGEICEHHPAPRRCDGVLVRAAVRAPFATLRARRGGCPRVVRSHPRRDRPRGTRRRGVEMDTR